MLVLSFSLLRCKGSENLAATDRRPCEMKTLPAKIFFPCMSGMFLCPAFRHRSRSLWHQFFGTIALMEFVLKNPCQQLCSFSFPPCQRSYACPMAQGLETLAGLGHAIFRNNRIVLMKFVLKNPCQQLCIFSIPSLPTKLCMSHRPTIANHLKSHGRTVFRHNRIDGICPETRASSASQYAVSSQRSKLFPTLSRPSTMSMLPSRSLPTELSPSYFPRLGRSETEATTGWRDGKPWEIAWGELRCEGARLKSRQGGQTGNRGK